MIRIDDLNFGYSRREPLFRHLDIAFEPGRVYGLLGMNGAGKSTLLKLMTGLLYCDSGRLQALGRAPERREPSFLSQVFMLPEELNLPGVIESEYLKMRAPFYRNFDYALFDRYVTDLDVPRGRNLTTLSYGQKKKFLLSFGLASGARLLVLDEPTNGLDIPSKGQFRRLIAQSLTEERLFIISTHQVQDVSSLIDSIVIVHGGRVLFDRTVADVASSLRMSHSTSRPEDDERLLYSEPAIGGFRSLHVDETAEDGHVDIELLFNAVISQPEICSRLFLREGRAA
jgi:ABC-2 type transport system ATP-binding protein